MNRRFVVASLVVVCVAVLGVGAVLVARRGSSSSTSTLSAGPTTTVTSAVPTSAVPATTVLPSTTLVAPTSTMLVAPTVVDDAVYGGDAAGGYSWNVKLPKLQHLASGTVQDAVNKEILAGVVAPTNDFITMAKTHPPHGLGGPPASTFTGTYEVHLLTKDVASLKEVLTGFFAGAAHPYTVVQAYTFDLTTGKRLALADLFSPSAPYLQLLSDQSRAQINATIPGDDPSFVNPGTAPKAENFAVWNLDEHDFLITFPTYQVGPGAAGTPTIRIPYATLRPVASPTGPLATLS